MNALEKSSPTDPPQRARLLCLLPIGERGPGGGATGKPLLLGAQGSGEHLPRQVPEPDSVCDSVLQRL